MAGVLGIPPRYCHEFISNALPRRPQRTVPRESPTSKGDKKYGLPVVAHRPIVKKPLKPSPPKSPIGYPAIDGKYYPTKEKAMRVTRAIEERERFKRWMENKEKDRLDRLKRAAKNGDVTFTKYGVFETKRCPECDVYHRVPSVWSMNEPCPSAAKKSKSKHISTQMSKKVLPEVATQTSKNLLPEVATQTSKGLLPNLGSRTSCMKTSNTKPHAERRKLRFKLVTECLVEEPSDCSTCASTDSKQSSESNMPVMKLEASPASCLKHKEEKKMDRRLAAALKYKEEVERKKESERVKVIEDSPSECSTCESTPTESSDCCSYKEEQEDDSEYLAQEQMVIWEEEALKERLEKEKKRYHENRKKLRRIKSENAEEEKQIKIDLDETKLNYAHALKRNMAIKAMLSMLNQNDERIKYTMEKEKAAQRVAEEKRKLNELLAEQMRIQQEKLNKSLDGEKESVQLPGETDSMTSSSSQFSIPCLSSFNINKMLNVSTSEYNTYTREEVRGSPVLMKNILDSLPTGPMSVSPSSTKMEPDSTESMKSRKQAMIHVRQGIVVLDKITQKLAKMMGYSILPASKAKVSKVANKPMTGKLPPIKRTQYPVNMITAPVELTNERSSSVGTQKPHEKIKPTNEKANTEPEAAAPMESMCGAPAGGVVKLLTAAEQRAIRRAKIQARIAELEKAKLAEMQKLQEIEEISEPAKFEPTQQTVDANSGQANDSTKEMEIAVVEETKEMKTEEAGFAKNEKEGMITEQKIMLDKYEAARIAGMGQEEKDAEKDKHTKLEQTEVKQSEHNAVLDEEDMVTKVKETTLAEYDHIISITTNHRIAQLELAKKEREAARIAALEPVERKKELARMAELHQAVVQKEESVTDGFEEPEETETDQCKDRAELERQVKIAKERKMNLAVYEQIISAATEWRIAQLEHAKKQQEAERLAELEPTEREEEIARLAELQQTDVYETVELESTEGTETDQSVCEEDMQPQREPTTSEEELAETFVEHKESHPRPPTPPPQHASMFQSHTSLFGPQMSLRTITEGGTCDFTPEFASPLTTHSFHAVVPYQSFRTKFGLRTHETMSDRQLGEEMRKLSQATVMVQNEILKRKRSKEAARDAAAAESTADGIDGKARKVLVTVPMTDSWEPPEDEATQVPDTVSAEEEKGETEWRGSSQADTVSETATDMATSVEDETDVSVAFSEQGDSATISVNEDAKSIEQASIKSTSVEALDEKASNESVNSPTKELLEPLEKDKAQGVASDIEASEKPSEPSEAEQQTDMITEEMSVNGVKETVTETMAESSPSKPVSPSESRRSSATSLKKQGSDFSQRSVQSWYSSQSLEEEYARVLDSAYSETTAAKTDSKTSITSQVGSITSIKQETSGRLGVEKKSSKCSINNKDSKTSLKSGSSVSSLNDANMKEGSKELMTEMCSECKADCVEAEQACSCKTNLSIVASEISIEDYMATLKSFSQSSVISKASNTSVKSKSSSRTSLKIGKDASLQFVPSHEPSGVEETQKVVREMANSSSKSSVKSKASKTSVKSNSGSQASLKDTPPQVAPQPETPETEENKAESKISQPGTPKSSSKSSIRSRRSSQVSLKDTSSMVGLVQPMTTEIVEKGSSSSSMMSYANAVKSSSKSSNTSLKSSSSSRASLTDKPDESPEKVEDRTAKSSSKSSVKSKSSDASVKSKSVSQVSLKKERSTEVKSQPDEAADISSQVATIAVPESSSISTVKSKASTASVRTKTGSQASLRSLKEVNAEDGPQPEAKETQVNDIIGQNAPDETVKSSSKSSIKSKASDTLMMSKSGSKASQKDTSSQVESQPDVETSQVTIDESSRDSQTGTQKSSSKLSVKSKASTASVIQKSKSGSQPSLKNETIEEEQSQPNPKDSEVTDISDQVIGTEMPKTSSKSSVRSKAIKTSVKSKSASQASLKNDVDATNEVACLANVEGSEVVDVRITITPGTPRSSSKSSVNSKSGSGSEMTTNDSSEPPPHVVSQPEPQETNNRSVEGEDASSEATKSFSKMSVKSKTSNVSVKSKPGSKTSLKDDSKESLKTEGVQETMETPSACTGTPNSLSRSSVKSKASKPSLKSDSGSQTLLKKDVTTSTDVVFQPHAKKPQATDNCSSSSEPATAVMTQSSSKSSIKSRASKTSLKSKIGSQASLKEAMETSPPKDGETTNTENEVASPETARSSSKLSIKSVTSNSVAKHKSALSMSLKDKSEAASKMESQPEKSYAGTPKSSSKLSVKSKASHRSVRSTSASQALLKNELNLVISQSDLSQAPLVSTDAPVETLKSSSKVSVKSKASNTSVKSKSGSKTSLNDKNKVKSQLDISQVPIVDNSSNDAPAGICKNSSKSSVTSKASKASVKSKSGSCASLNTEIKEAKSQSDPSQVPTLDNNSSADAHAEMPKISSASSVKSKASNTSVRSKLGSQASLKKETETFPSSEIREPQEIDGKDSSAGIPKSSSRSSRASQPSLRVFMNAMSDVATKESTPVIKRSLSRLSTSSNSRVSSAKQETSRTPSNASVKVSGSPNRSSTSLKSLRKSLKSLILPSMGSEANVDTTKVQGSAENIETKQSNASVTRSGSLENASSS